MTLSQVVGTTVNRVQQIAGGTVLYQARQFEAAGALFTLALAATHGNDGPSAVYVERCMELIVWRLSPCPT